MNDTWDGERDPLMALSEGRSGPFEAFVHAETRTFLGFFRRLGAGRNEAEDLVQDCFKKLYELVRSDRPGSAASYTAQGQFRGFAFRMARNVWIDHARRAASQRGERDAFVEDGALLAAPDPSLEGPLESMERSEEAQRIRRAVESLSGGQRDVFVLGVLEELPYSEISAALDIPVGTVKSRMFHAVQNVRAAIEAADAVSERRTTELRRGGGNR